MRTTTKSVLIAIAFGMIAYAMIDGIRYESGWGVAMAMCSLAALYISVRLSRKLAKMEEAAEEE